MSGNTLGCMEREDAASKGCWADTKLCATKRLEDTVLSAFISPFTSKYVRISRKIFYTDPQYCIDCIVILVI